MEKVSRFLLTLKPVIAEKAKENQGTRNDICQKSDKSIDTKKEIAKAAGVSPKWFYPDTIVNKLK